MERAKVFLRQLIVGETVRRFRGAGIPQAEVVVAGWLSKSFRRAFDLAKMRAYAQPLPNVTLEFPPPAEHLSRAKLASQHGTRPVIPPLAAPLPAFISPVRGHRSPVLSTFRQRGGLRDDPIPRMCWECRAGSSCGTPRLLHR